MNNFLCLKTIQKLKFKIRKGKKKDIPKILELIKELASYEKAISEVDISEKDLLVDGFGKKKWYWFIVAERDNEILGMSFYFVRYSTWKGKILFLEDFIVKKKYRRFGIGRKLFEETIKVCKEQNLNGMCWQVLDWNEIAINFYKKYNSNISDEWLNGRLTKNQIEKF